MDSGTLAKVLHDFLTTVEGELSLSKGDFFLVHKIIDKHWCYGESNKRVGKFPINCLHKVEIPIINNNESLFISIAPFRGQEIGDLSFTQGEIIIGKAQASSGWLTGHIGSRDGIFPDSYVWQLDLSLLKKSCETKIVKKKAKVTTTLKAQLDEELDLIEGEIITVTEILEDGWCRGYNEDGKEGTFPENFIIYQEDVIIDEPDRSMRNSSASENLLSKSTVFKKNYKEEIRNQSSDPIPCYEDLFPNTGNPSNQITDYNPLGVKPYAITLFPFNAQFVNELSFEAGQVVELVKYIDNEWVEGIIDNTKGIFPVSYVNIIVDCTESQSNENHDNIQKSQDNLQLNDSVKVQYNFEAQMDGDLNVSEGEIVTVVEITNNDWIIVRNGNGNTGLCPRGYVTADFEVNDEVFYNAPDDFVEVRHENKPTVNKEVERTKRLSEPHRPAPPAPTPGRVPLQKPNNQSVPEDKENVSSVKKKEVDLRQKVITELYMTEKDYVRDLKMTYETFHLHNPVFLESRGIDVKTLFGNIVEITQIAEELLELIQRAMKGIDEDYQTIGPCFIKMSEKMRHCYGKYCSNHELSLALLQKYDDNKDIMNIFDKGVETLRMQVVCFDMDSILIKPVQRILKYPLILNELLKCTDDNHPDKPKIEEASKVMADVASYINEYKRKKDLASKYLHSNNTLIGKMANLNMHSVAKKSSRLGMKLSATLGLSNLKTDAKFDELEKDFIALERSTKQFLKDVEQCRTCLDHEASCSNVLTEKLHQYFMGVSCDEVNQLQEIRHIIQSRYTINFKKTIESRVISPLNNLISLMVGPELLINKRHDKMLDYDAALSKNEKCKEKGTTMSDLCNAKSNFEALNQQLLEELPIFISASIAILYNCIGAFTNARKVYNANIMEKYLVILETVKDVSIKNILESFAVHHNLLHNQISRLSYGGTNTRMEGLIDYCLQTETQVQAVKTKYAPNKLFVVTQSLKSSTPHDLSVSEGTLVGVIKTMDPMCDTKRWLVDTGSGTGFVQSQYLKPVDVAKLIDESGSASCSSATGDLMSLDSPVKEIKRYSADVQSLYSNVSDDQAAPPPYQNIESIETEQRQLYENIRDEIVYALYNFHQPNIPGTLSVQKGQELKVLQKHDNKMNPNWWLVEDYKGEKGFVPHNYVKDRCNSN